WIWEAHDIPALPVERWSPSSSSLAAGVAVNCVPPPGGVRDPGAAFDQWTDVSRWTATLMDPMSAPDDSVALTAKRLVSGARSRADSVRAIGHYVQRMQYASLALNLRTNGGYRPRAAHTVLATGYGDCKDKANVMRSMLHTVGIPSYPVVISG